MILPVCVDVTLSIVRDRGCSRRRPGVVSSGYRDRGRAPGGLRRLQAPARPAAAAPTALAVAWLLSGLMAAYSPGVWVRALATGVGGLYGARRGPARDWFRRMTAAHRVVACVAASAALLACAMTFASTHQRAALSPAGITIATVTYVSFAVIPIMRWPPWLAGAVTTAGAAASMAAGTPDILIGPALVVSLVGFSLRSEKTPAIAGTAAVIGVLGPRHPACFRLDAN